MAVLYNMMLVLEWHSAIHYNIQSLSNTKLNNMVPDHEHLSDYGSADLADHEGQQLIDYFFNPAI